MTNASARATSQVDATQTEVVRTEHGYVRPDRLPSHHPARIYRPFDEAYEEFAQAHPELHMGLHATTRTRFRQAFGQELQRIGALIPLGGGRFLAHHDRFPSAAFAAVAGLPLPDFGPTNPIVRKTILRTPPVPGRGRGRPRKKPADKQTATV